MSTLHAALTGLLAAKDETGDRLVHVDTIRDALRRHPAPEAGEVRLSEAERVGIDQSLADSGCHGFIGDHADLYAAVERILAARLAEVAQPAGETRVEPHAYAVEALWNQGSARPYWAPAMEMSEEDQPLSRSDAENLMLELVMNGHLPDALRLVQISVAEVAGDE